MATTALEVLPRDTCKAKLRIPDSDTSQDALLDGHIGTAVAWLSQEIDLPLLDQTGRLYALPGAPTRPLPLAARAIRRIEAIRYWPAGGAGLRSAPAGEIDRSTLGRTYVPAAPGRVPPGAGVYPPAPGWPAVEPGTQFEIEVTRGFELTDDDEHLRDAVALVVRLLHDGFSEIRPTQAFWALVAPYRYHGPLFPDPAVSAGVDIAA